MASSDFTIADVLEWARTKPADELYRYNEPCSCALAQFLRETGRAISPGVADTDWYDFAAKPRVVYLIDAELDQAAHSKTFGEFVQRLETLCPTAPVTRSDWLAIDAYMHDIEQVSA